MPEQMIPVGMRRETHGDGDAERIEVVGQVGEVVAVDAGVNQQALIRVPHKNCVALAERTLTDEDPVSDFEKHLCEDDTGRAPRHDPDGSLRSAGCESPKREQDCHHRSAGEPDLLFPTTEPFADQHRDGERDECGRAVEPVNELLRPIARGHQHESDRNLHRNERDHHL
jgi:hypothetical protein